MADVILLLLSGTTNGRLAVEGFHELEKRTGQRLAHLAEGSEDKRITYADTQARPVPVITSPEWSGSETGGRRYAPFTINIENLKPFHTLTGRMHFYLAHDWIEELGEQLPVFRPPLDMARLFGQPALGDRGRNRPHRAVSDAALEVVIPLRPIRTTCTCCRCPAAVRPCG